MSLPSCGGQHSAPRQSHYTGHTLIPANHLCVIVSGLEHLTMVKNNLKNTCKGTNCRYYEECKDVSPAVCPVCSAVLADRQLQVLTSPAAVTRILSGGTSLALVTQPQLVIHYEGYIFQSYTSVTLWHLKTK